MKERLFAFGLAAVTPGCSKPLNKKVMRTTFRSGSLLACLLFSLIISYSAASVPKEEVLKPYSGPSIRGSDPGTLKGKVMAGYQGWFNCEGDGADLGWTHWAKNRTFVLLEKRASCCVMKFH